MRTLRRLSLIVKVAAPDVPPPGAGLNTVTLDVPTLPMSAAVTCAASCVPPTNVVKRSLPFHRTTEPSTKPVPLMESVNATSPFVLLVGEMAVIVGRGISTARLSEFEMPPPGAGLTTVTGCAPTVAMSAATICAISLVLSINVVARALPSNRTTAPLTKLLPLTVSVNPASPAPAFAGERPLTKGKGFSTVKLIGLAVPPPGVGLETTIGNVPPNCASAAVISAVRWAASTKVVTRSLPLNLTTEPGTKLEPLTVSVKPLPPAVTLIGERASIMGIGFSTVNPTASELPPPGVGLATVMRNAPAD